MNHSQAIIQSAAARTFAIPELLEHIILDVISAERNSKKMQMMARFGRYLEYQLVGQGPRSYITSPFILRQVNHDFHHTILGSSKITNSCLLDIRGFAPPSFYERFTWLTDTCEAWDTKDGLVLHAEWHSKLDDSVHASWRNVLCVPEEHYDRDRPCSYIVFFQFPSLPRSRKRLPNLLVDGNSTLGQLYDQLKVLQRQAVSEEQGGLTASGQL